MTRSTTTPVPVRRLLLTGWFSPLHGEATAGDLFAHRAVAGLLDGTGAAYDTAWSPSLVPRGPSLADCDPARYSHLVFVCGPLHGEPLVALHRRYAEARRIAVGVSVTDPADSAVTGFHSVIARDSPGAPALRDMSAAMAAALGGRATPSPDSAGQTVTGVILTEGQQEYGHRRLHSGVRETLTGWMARTPLAPVVMDTRVDTGDGLLPSTPDAFQAVVRRLDLVVTTRLHGLVLALAAGVPVLAVDPVAGGAKVGAQAAAWGWPVVRGEDVACGAPAHREAVLDRALAWCLSPEAADLARRCHAQAHRAGEGQLAALAAELGP